MKKKYHVVTSFLKYPMWVIFAYGTPMVDFNKEMSKAMLNLTGEKMSIMGSTN